MSVRLRDVVRGQLDALRHEPSEKRIRATLGGQTVVDSTRALLVCEPKRVYKGAASYWSVGDEQHLAWCYRHPLRDASEVVDRIAFFNERVDVVVDGVGQERQITPWSPRD
jgi:uncharacterized protein (DUF427 family)